MNKFRVGDLVECVDASKSSGQLKEGMRYIVSYSDDNVICVDNLDIGWSNDRFELVESHTLESEIAYSEISVKTFPYSLHISGTKITGELTEEQLDVVLNILVKGK